MIDASVGHLLLHYTGGDNGNSPWYLEPSGFIGAVEGLSVVGVLAGGLRHINCKEPGCWRPGHPVVLGDGTHIRSCHRHHPTHPRKRRSHPIGELHRQHSGPCAPA